MKPHRIRLLSASLALATAPFIGAALNTPALASGAITIAATSPESAYGLAARLPKDTEGFLSFYHLSDLWDGFKSSNFLKKVMSNESLVRKLDIEKLLKEWEKNAELRKYGTMAASLLGNEVTIAVPAGFTGSFSKILKQIPTLQAAFFTARASSGKGVNHGGMPPQMLPVVEAVSELEVPPLIISMKAGAYRDDLKGLINMALSGMPPDVKSKLDTGKFETGGYSFETISVKVDKVMPDRHKEEMKKDLVEAFGSEEKGNALAKKLLAKTVELSFGWVDDYLVLSIGPDHSHLKFTTAADSVLSHPDVAQRAAQFAPKKPLSFSYTSQLSLKTFNELGGVMKSLVSLAESANEVAGLPVKLDGVITELKSLDAKANTIWPNDPDAAIGAIWWDGGLRAEGYGGNKPRAYDNSRPLTLSGLATEKSFITVASRSNGPFRDKVFGFLEDVAGSIWNIYQKEVKTYMPDDVRQGAAMGEMVGLPLVKELWKSLQTFRAAMGDESAFFLNLDGVIPEIQGAHIPSEFVSKGRMPRVAWMSELKDRAKLTESWNGLKTLISSAAAIAASQTRVNIPTEPTMKIEGSLEMFGYKLPIETGDLWPHTAIDATHWFLSSSPSFTKELASKTPAASGTACGSHWNVNFNALWSFAADWAKIIPDAQDSGASQKINFVLSLLHSLNGIDIVTGEESGQAHDTVHLIIKDIE